MADSIQAGAFNRTAECLPAPLSRFMTLFNRMDRHGVEGLDQVYSADVCFIDPFTRVDGLEELGRYFINAYDNVISARFDFDDAIVQGNTCALAWTMHLSHRRLRQGRPIRVDGLSCLHLQEELIRYHRDYFDAGQLLYQNVPVLGPVVRWLKGQAS